MFENVLPMLGYLVLFLIVVSAFLSTFVVTPERHFKFISLLGKYQKTCRPGLSLKIPFLTAVDGTIFTGRDNQPVELSLKTKDEMTFELGINIQYEISSEVMEAYKAVYNIEDYKRDMQSVSINAAISIANEMTIKEIFNDKDRITGAIKAALSKFFAEFGINIHDVFCDEPRLPAVIEDRNNNLIAARRDKEAAHDIAAKIKIEKIGAAEADGESVKIRSNKLGEAREEYATKTAIAVKKLMDVGATADSALAFLNKIGEQDALVTASRNGSTIVFSNNHDAGTNKSADTLLAMKLDEDKGTVKAAA
jgi:regulator of protease activity HflC (stomatin/prohibitin superfamily)